MTRNSAADIKLAARLQAIAEAKPEPDKGIIEYSEIPGRSAFGRRLRRIAAINQGRQRGTLTVAQLRNALALREVRIP
jgi:hypothetical protein